MGELLLSDITRKFEKLFINNGIDDHSTLVKIHYGLEVIRNEAIKLIILFILFSVIGSALEFVFSVLILFPLRFTSGGMHLKTNVGCFLYSLGFFILTINILPLINAPIALLFSLLIISAIIVISISPVESYKRPITSVDRRISMKKKSIAVFTADCIVLILLYYFGANYYFIIGAWIVMLQAIQLLATLVFRKRKGEKNVSGNQGMETVATGGSGN